MRLFVGALMLGAVWAARGAAQDGPRATALPQWELRGDATFAQASAAHVGVGVNVRAGWYARIGGVLAAGIAESDGDVVASQRLDLTVRFLLDPFAEYERALYGGAGLTARRDGDARVDARLLLVLGAEGAPLGRVRPSIELGLGGGVRVGVVLRRLRPGPAR